MRARYARFAAAVVAVLLLAGLACWFLVRCSHLGGAMRDFGD
jgi:hypothetical protein